MVNRYSPDLLNRKKALSPSGVFIHLFVLIAVLVSVIPILHIIALSLSGRTAVLSQRVVFWPVDLDFAAYETVFRDVAMFRSLFFSCFLTAVYTLMSITFSILLAYPLSRQNLPGKKFILILILIPMYFSGGIIPEYLWMKSLGLIDNPLSLILPVMVSTYNTIILRNFFQSLPNSLEEMAHIEGCNDFGILIRIVLPLSKAALATISLFYAVFRWNTFNDVLYYINRSEYYTLQLKLYQIVFNNMDVTAQQVEGSAASSVLPASSKSACIVFSTLPILIVYPFLQKYFVQGVILGAVKE